LLFLKAENAAASANWKRRCKEGAEGGLLRDVVAALPGGVLRGFDLPLALAAEDADKTPHCVLLP
jgi:hypothetical protein